MPEIDKTEALKRIAKWMGWKIRKVSGALRFDPPNRSSYVMDPRHGGYYEFDPFTILADAFALQAEIERRGLVMKFVAAMGPILWPEEIPSAIENRWGFAQASADQRTRAVLSVIEQEAANA